MVFQPVFHPTTFASTTPPRANIRITLQSVLKTARAKASRKNLKIVKSFLIRPTEKFTERKNTLMKMKPKFVNQGDRTGIDYVESMIKTFLNKMKL